MKNLAVIAVLVISVLAVVSFVLVHNSEKSLELVGNGVGEIDTSGMDLSFLACNPSPVPVEVDGIGVLIAGGSGPYGDLEIRGTTLGPHSAKAIGGRIVFSDYGSMKSFVGSALGEASDPDFKATMHVRERLLGILPYSYEKDYAMNEFSGVLFGNTTWSCGGNGNFMETRQAMELAWARMSAAGFLYSSNTGLGNSTNSTLGKALP